MEKQINSGANGKAVGPQNPPAFPFVFDAPHPLNPTQMTRQVMTGMSLRDYFAAKAMQALMTDDNDPELFNINAEFAYRQADAMLAQRVK
jgi:hypothetical protein